MDKASFKRLAKIQKQQPAQFARGTSMFLNTLAEGTRNTAIEVIKTDRHFISRNKTLPAKFIRFEGNRRLFPIDAQRSRTFSMQGPRFTGWIEQITGKVSSGGRSRTFTGFARGGNRRKQARPKARLKPGRSRRDVKDFQGSFQSDHHRAVAFLSALGRERYKEPFALSGHKRLAPGLFLLQRGRKLKRLQYFKGMKSVERFDWMGTARRTMFSRLNAKQTWGIILDKVFRLGLNIG
jgi:hypothetical protein